MTRLSVTVGAMGHAVSVPLPLFLLFNAVLRIKMGRSFIRGIHFSILLLEMIAGDHPLNDAPGARRRLDRDGYVRA